MKNDAAEVTREFINANGGDPQEIAALVEDWFRSRGVDVRYRSRVAYTPKTIGGDRPDDYRTLKWLRSAATPALARLGERYTRDALVAWLFDGCTMDDMDGDRANVEEIARRYDERSADRRS